MRIGRGNHEVVHKVCRYSVHCQGTLTRMGALKRYNATHLMCRGQGRSRSVKLFLGQALEVLEIDQGIQ